MMPLSYTLISPYFMDLDQISPLIKKTVDIADLPLGDNRLGFHLSYRTKGLPVAIAGRELVAHDLQNNPRAAGPRRVAVFGPSAYLVEGFRYVVELAHPEMFVIDILNPAIPSDIRFDVLAELPADLFDYLILIGNHPEEDLRAFSSDDWNLLKTRMEYDPVNVMDSRTVDWSKSAHKKWLVRLRRFLKGLLQRRWKRVDLSVGPIYQAVDQGQRRSPSPGQPNSR